MMALTRLPSGRRASTIGLRPSMWRPVVAIRGRSFGRSGPRVDELQLEERSRRGDRGNDPLALGQPDLDREPNAVVDLARFHVRRDPLAVAEAQDRPPCGGLVAWIDLQLWILNRAD